MEKLNSFAAAALYLMLALGMAHGQVATGNPPFAALAGGPDVIDLGNLNVHFTIPIISRAGRGIPFYYNLQYDSSVFMPVTSNGHTTWAPVNSNWGWQTQTDAGLGYITYKLVPGSCNAYNNWTYHDQYGTPHPFTTTVYSGSGCNPTSTQIETSDGSGYTLVATSAPSAYVLPRGGGKINAPLQSNTGNGSVIDANGNQISVSNRVYTDTLGTTVLTIAGTYPTTYTYTAPSGGNAVVTVNYGTYTVKTNFNAPGITDPAASVGYLITSIVLPDGTYYNFGYEPTPSTPTSGACTPLSGTWQVNCITGRIGSVTLPTGGQIAYSYHDSNGYNGIWLDGSTTGFDRTTPDTVGSPNGKWSYDRQGGVTTVIDPQGNQTLFTSSGIYETQRQIYQLVNGTQTLLETMLNCYNNNFTNCATATVSAPITRKLAYPTFPSGRRAAFDNYFNGNGSLTESDIYDFTTGSFGSPTQKTVINYLTLGTILDRPSSVIVEDGSSNVLAKTTYSYDDTAVTATPVCPGTNCTPQHGTAPGTSRGNLTTVNLYTHGSTYLTKKFSYFDTGTVQTITDVNLAQTTYGYPDSTSTCGNSFPTSVTFPTINSITLTRSMAYNCTGGVQKSVTDENGNTASARYVTDPYFWRPDTVYDLSGYATNLGYVGATIAESDFILNGNSSVYQFTTLDSMGRTRVQQQRQSPSSSNYDSVEQDYDAQGRPYRGSMPYVAGQGQTFPSGTPVTTTNYDPLGRPSQVTDGGGGTVNYTYTDNDVLIKIGPATQLPTVENLKQRQLEYDALGRLTSVCELTTGTGSGSCLQNSAQTGYWTNYAYSYNATAGGPQLKVTQNAQAGSGSQQTRTFVYDLLGRLISETNPESNVTTYAYDADPVCGGPAYNGDLIRRNFASGDFTCNAYDALHRLYQTLHYGSLASVTSNYEYIYDAATITINGVPTSMANAKGRLARAYGCLPGCSSSTSDSAFSYSPRGEVKDTYELTSHSGGYFHSQAGYWPHGPISSLSLYGTNGSAVTGFPTLTYGATDASGLDGEGRITKVSAPSPLQSPVTAVAYNGSAQPVGALSQTTFGSNDYDSFSYDASTGRMTRYQFVVNGQTDTGNLTWNPNGSLQNLVVTDNLPNSQDSQTCNYSHDDLARLANINCFNPLPFWSDVLSYDAFGNISKTSGSIIFTPGYNSATNRINGFTYDNGVGGSNGNLTNDTVHTYSWDGDGKMIAVGSVNLIYDALGRMVEQANGPSYTEIVYDPTGAKLALMNGNSLSKAFVALPGGATAVYNSSGLAYYRHSDWLGSSRAASSPLQAPIWTGAYAPFGESYAESTVNNTYHSFTGQNEDTASGLDDFMFREYSASQQGRWISPDPAGLDAVDITDPQTWNRYAYLGNRPLNNVDPLGLDPLDKCVEDDFTACVTGDGGGGGGFINPGGCYEILIDGFDSGNTCGGGPGGGGYGGGGGGGIPLPPPPAPPKAPPVTFTCTGNATYTGVGGNQAPDPGALFSTNGGPSVLGGSNGTVAISRYDNNTFNLSKASLRVFGPYIQVAPQGLNQNLSNNGGPLPPFTVSDIGDKKVVTGQFDIYRFPTKQDAVNFGKQTAPTTITVPAVTGAQCPPGFTKN